MPSQHEVSSESSPFDASRIPIRTPRDHHAPNRMPRCRLHPSHRKEQVGPRRSMVPTLYQILVDEFIDQIIASVRTVGLLADLVNGDSGCGPDSGRGCAVCESLSLPPHVEQRHLAHELTPSGVLAHTVGRCPLNLDVEDCSDGSTDLRIR